MKKSILPFTPFFCIAFTFLLSTQQLLSIETSVDAQLGYRKDSLNWNIAGPLNDPNVLSELKWSDLEICQLSLQWILSATPRLYMRSYADIGLIVKGQCQDSDYDGNNRTEEFMRSYSRSNGDYVFDISAGYGWLFNIYETCQVQWDIAPIAGLSYHRQELIMTDGEIYLDAMSNQLGRFNDLHSTYKAQWFSPWIGADMVLNIQQKFTLRASYELHYAAYCARGFWNLRTDYIDDFKHNANGFGQIFVLEARYALSSCLSLGIITNCQLWKTFPGQDTIYFNEIDSDNNLVAFKAKTKLNRVNWHSLATSAEIGYNF